MKVLVAGASGALGVPLTRQLIAHGHKVLGLTRDRAGAPPVAVRTPFQGTIRRCTSRSSEQG